jgi:hypothetical protein
MKTFWQTTLAPFIRAVGRIFGRSSTGTGVAFYLTLFTIFTTVLISRLPVRQVPDYRVGDQIKTDLIAPTELIVVDPERTQRLRTEEAMRVPPVFRHYPTRLSEATTALREYFAQTREQLLKALESATGKKQLSRQEVARRDSRFRAALNDARARATPFPISDELAEPWARGETGEDVLTRLESALRAVMSGYIRPDEQLQELTDNPTGEVRLVPALVHAYEGPERMGQHPTMRAIELTTLMDARKALRRGLSESDARQYGDLVSSLVRVNCLFADDLTRESRRQATEHIVATNRYGPRQVIAERGQTATPQIVAAIGALKNYQVGTRSGRRFIGLLLIVAALYYALWRFSKRVRVYYLTSFKIFLLAAITVFVQTFIVRVGMSISSGVAYRIGEFDSPEAYQFAIPYATAALIVALLLESRIALTVGFTVALLVGFLTEDPATMAYALLSSIVAVYGVGRYQRRDTITRAGLIIGGINILATFVITMAAAKPIVLGPVLFNSLFAMTGGVLVAALAAFALPVNESLFGILTDVKLLELSNVELPLLKRLAIEAPGTYQHVLIVATLAEAAAKAIGANSLYVRIGSYYHDIGKLAHPDMYVENQRRSVNPHDLLMPEQSAQILKKHVTEGIRMGEEAKLPRQIIDLIPQHHGTRRLHYFYNKAMQLALAAEKPGKPGGVGLTGRAVDEKVFRYPGPKPQSIEAAIVMMCDSAEAASRSLRNRTPENIELIVRKIIDDIVTDGQLDECNLRMRDLKVIRQTILQTLANIYHQRVPYPGFTEEELAHAPPSYEGLPDVEPVSPAPATKAADLDLSIDESWPSGKD